MILSAFLCFYPENEFPKEKLYNKNGRLTNEIVPYSKPCDEEQ
jgi:hypothetical protein